MEIFYIMRGYIIISNKFQQNIIKFFILMEFV